MAVLCLLRRSGIRALASLSLCLPCPKVMALLGASPLTSMRRPRAPLPPFVLERRGRRPPCLALCRLRRKACCVPTRTRRESEREEPSHVSVCLSQFKGSGTSDQGSSLPTVEAVGRRTFTFTESSLDHLLARLAPPFPILSGGPPRVWCAGQGAQMQDVALNHLRRRWNKSAT